MYPITLNRYLTKNQYKQYIYRLISEGVIITAQIPDLFLFENEEYALAGVNGELFIPEKWGMHPIGMCSANWKGYLVIYALQDDKLVLNQLRITLGEFNKRDSPSLTPLL